MTFRRFAPALLLVGSACIMDEAATEEQFNTENDIRVTYNGDLTLLGSYHELFDSSTDTTCVRYSSGERRARVGEPTRKLAIDQVRRKEELAQKLGVGVAAGKNLGVVSASASTDMLSEFTSASNSVTFLLTAEADYVVRDAAGDGQDIVLAQKGVQALSQGPAAFARTCGTHYIHAVRYGARLHLLITFRAMSHEAHMQMVSSLGLDGSIAGSAEIKNRLEQTSRIEGVTVNIQASSSGFWLDQAGWESARGALEAGSLESSLAKAGDLYAALTRAVEREYCLDSGEGSCNGAASPGYFNRSRRDTTVTGVQLASYHTLASSSAQGTLSKIKKRVETTKAFLQSYAELDMHLDTVYTDEIRPFMEAEPHQKVEYNIAPPGTPKRTPDEVYAVAKAVEQKVFPPAGGLMGDLRKVVQQRMVACLDTVNFDITKSCTAGDTYAGPAPAPAGELNAEQTKQYRDLEAFLNEHQATSRIVPMSYAHGGDAVTYPNAQEQCEDLAADLNADLEKQGSVTRVVYRLPTKAEAALLATLVGYGAISWSGADYTNTIWYAPQSDCGANYPFFRNQPTASQSSYGCSVNDYWDEDLAVICVPASGPVPVLDAR